MYLLQDEQHIIPQIVWPCDLEKGLFSHIRYVLKMMLHLDFVIGCQHSHNWHMFFLTPKAVEAVMDLSAVTDTFRLSSLEN